MDITHVTRGAKRFGTGCASSLLTNRCGDFLSLTTPCVSDYDGLYFHDATGNHFKILSDILPQSPITRMTNKLSSIQRTTEQGIEEFSLFPSGLVYSHKGTNTIILTVDCKYIHENDTFGRVYELSQEKNSLWIKYTKYTNDTLSQKQYTKYILIELHQEESSLKITQINQWRKIYLPYDSRRKMQAERYVFDAFSITGSFSSSIVCADSKEKAQEKLLRVKNEQQESSDNSTTNVENEQDVRLLVAKNAFHSLVIQKNTEEKGIYAGLPWFHQFWMRDEAISCIGLLLEKKYLLVKTILMRWVEKIAKQNTHANELHESNTSADGPGLIAKRLYQLLSTLSLEKRIKDFFTNQELERIHSVYTFFLENLRFQHDLVRSTSKETWMDTIERSGCRIEIQACTLAMYDLQIFLEKQLKKPYKETLQTKKELIQIIRSWFYDVHGKILDGYTLQGNTDETIRPNIFLAWYIAPDMFLEEQWEKGFDSALTELWLPWGGLSSVSVQSTLYHPTHLGVSDESYHNGDSWYFINNICAMALFTLQPHKYSSYIEKIVDASTNDLLFQGYLGHASELSDANEQRSSGCRAQAWSAAMYIELLTLMKNH